MSARRNFALLTFAAAAAAQPPVIPAGLDAYRMWDRWAYQRIGARTYYGTGYSIYQQFVNGAQLSHPIAPWNEEPPARDVLDLVARAGTDIAPPGLTEASGKLAPGATAVWSARGAAVIRRLEFSVP